MTQEEYQKAQEAMSNAGILNDGKTFYRMKNKRRSSAETEARAIFKAFNIDADAFLEESFNRLADERQEDAEETPDIQNWFEVVKYVNPQFQLDDEDFTEVDENVFKRIKYAYDEVNGSPLILVNVRDKSWKSILPGPLASAELRRACALALPDDKEKYKNLKAELLAKTSGYLTKMFESFGSPTGKIHKQQELVEALRKYLPHSLLTNYGIRVMVSVEEKKVAEGEPPRKFKRPHGAYFVNSIISDQATKADVFDLLADKAGVMFGQPSMTMKLPKIYSNDDSEPAFVHLNLDDLVDENMPHPTWDEYWTRYTPEEAAVFRAFIWSIFDASNNGRQLLYVLDVDGFSGKTIVVNVISAFLGCHLVQALQKDSMNNRFSMSKVWDKRLLVIDDNKNPQLIRSEKMHMILGGGLADVEHKGRDSFSARIQCKVIANGNTPLAIDPEAAHERTRLLIVRPRISEKSLSEICAKNEDGSIMRDDFGRPITIGDRHFEGRLLSEFKGMMAQARADYSRLCPTGSSIIPPPVIQAALEDSVDVKTAVLEEISSEFEFNESYTMSSHDFRLAFNAAKLETDNEKEDASFEDFCIYLSKRFPYFKSTSRVKSGPRLAKGVRRKGIEKSDSKPSNVI